MKGMRGIFIDDLNFKEVKIRTVILIYFITLLIMSGIIVGIMINFGTEISNASFLILNLIMDLIVAAMLIFAFRPSVYSIKLLAADMIKKANKKEILSVIVFKFLITMGGGKLLIDLLNLLDDNSITGFVCDLIIKIDGPIQYIISAFILCLLSPIIEELIFRNVVFKRIAKRFNVNTGIVISSIVFAAINIGNGVIGAFIFGIANCYMYIKYKNIFIPILINFLYNLLLCVSVIPFLSNSFNNIFLSTSNLAISMLIASLMFVVGMVLFIKFLSRNNKYIVEYDYELKRSLDGKNIREV